jgi:anti-anti-sigma factor
VHTIVLRGELDLASAPALEEAMGTVDGAGTVTLYLRPLAFIDSTGVRATLAVREHCTRGGIDFTLIPGPKQVQRLFEIVGLLDVLPFEGERNGHSIA